MKTINDIYKPYDFSANPCYVIRLLVHSAGYVKIEQKLPGYVQKLTGIFVSTDCLDADHETVGYISLSFNGNAFKTFNTYLFKTIALADTAHPQPLNEPIEKNSLMQGYFIATTKGKDYPFTVRIYLHYAK